MVVLVLVMGCTLPEKSRECSDALDRAVQMQNKYEGGKLQGSDFFAGVHDLIGVGCAPRHHGYLAAMRAYAAVAADSYRVAVHQSIDFARWSHTLPRSYRSEYQVTIGMSEARARYHLGEYYPAAALYEMLIRNKRHLAAWQRVHLHIYAAFAFAALADSQNVAEPDTMQALRAEAMWLEAWKELDPDRPLYYNNQRKADIFSGLSRLYRDHPTLPFTMNLSASESGLDPRFMLVLLALVVVRLLLRRLWWRLRPWFVRPVRFPLPREPHP